MSRDVATNKKARRFLPRFPGCQRRGAKADDSRDIFRSGAAAALLAAALEQGLQVQVLANHQGPRAGRSAQLVG